MIRGKFEIVGGKGEIVDQRIRKLDPGDIGYELLEVKLKFDANGEVEASIPFVSGHPSMWGLKLGVGPEAPGVEFDVAVTGKFGELLDLPVLGFSIASAAGVDGDIAPVSIVPASVSDRQCGPMTIKADNSQGPENAGKTFTVGIQFVHPVYGLTA